MTVGVGDSGCIGSLASVAGSLGRSLVARLHSREWRDQGYTAGLAVVQQGDHGSVMLVGTEGEEGLALVARLDPTNVRPAAGGVLGHHDEVALLLAHDAQPTGSPPWSIPFSRSQRSASGGSEALPFC